MTTVTQQDRLEWLDHPVTREMLGQLKGLTEESKTNWASGGLQKETLEQTALANAKSLGAVQMLYTVIAAIEEPAMDEATS